MIGWDEIAPTNLLPTTLVQHWRPDGSPTAAVAKGAKVIMSVANRAYLDMKYDADTPLGLNWAGFIDVTDRLRLGPGDGRAGNIEASILGVEAPIWTETLANIRDVEFMAFPRLPASGRGRVVACGPRLGTNSAGAWRHRRLAGRHSA